MNYEIVQAVQEAIDRCIEDDSCVLTRKDNKGNITLWIEAFWSQVGDGRYEVVRLDFLNPVGKIEYQYDVMETVRLNETDYKEGFYKVETEED